MIGELLFVPLKTRELSFYPNVHFLSTIYYFFNVKAEISVESKLRGLSSLRLCSVAEKDIFI